MSSTPQKKTSLRILIVRIGAMGDVLHALPAVTALREQMPDARIGWCVDPRWAPLLAAHTRTGAPLVDNLHLVPVREWKKNGASMATAHSILALRRELRAAQYDIAVDLQGTLRSSVVGRLAGARLFMGPANPRELPAKLFYSQTVLPHQLHVVEMACEILGAATGLALAPGSPVLDESAEAAAWCEATLPQTRFIVIIPSSYWGIRRWPAERYASLAIALAERGYISLVSAAGPHDELAQRVVEASQGTAHAIPCDIPQLAAMLRRAALCIGSDTGPLHIAAAVGTPVVGIYGPTDPARTGPFIEAKRILRSPRSVTTYRHTAEIDPGLLDITVEDGLHSAMELLNPTE